MFLFDRYSQFQEQVELLSKDNKRLINDSDDKKIDVDKFKVGYLFTLVH